MEQIPDHKILPLILNISKKYSFPGIDIQDLIQEGRIGVWEASIHFDPEKGCKFSTYATFWIEKRIKEFIKTASFHSADISIDEEEEVEEETETMLTHSDYRNYKHMINKVGNLSEREKAVLALNMENLKTFNEIAGILEIPRDQVKQLQRRGVRKIRIYLESQGKVANHNE